MNTPKDSTAERTPGSLHPLVRRWERLGELGVTVSICFGECGNLAKLYSVDALGPSGETFDKPFAAETLEQAMHIAEKEATERGWIAPNSVFGDTPFDPTSPK